MRAAPERSAVLQSLLSLALVLLAAVIATAVLLWLFQARLVFQPTRGAYPATPAALSLPWRDLELTADDGTRLAAWYIEAPSAGAPVVLFLHGNAGDMSHRLDRVASLHGLGAAVLMIDYRGYGRSEGSPSEAGLKRDVRAAWDWLTDVEGIAPGRIVVHGRSLGAALAAWIAAERRPAAVVLESAFVSLPALAADVYPWLPARALARYRFDTEAELARASAPVLIAHSPTDEIIAYRHGEALARVRPADTTLVRLEGGHNARTLVPGNAFHDALRRVLRDAAAPGAE